MNEQPEALRLADRLHQRVGQVDLLLEAADELRRLHAENEALRLADRLDQWPDPNTSLLRQAAGIYWRDATTKDGWERRHDKEQDMNTLREAAQAVLDRWDSPTWEWVKQGPTADLMANLRAALEAPEPLTEWQLIDTARSKT